MVHALWVDRIAADVRVEQQALILAMSRGVKAEWPDLDERVAEFEARLAAEPKYRDPEELELRQALGVR